MSKRRAIKISCSVLVAVTGHAVAAWFYATRETASVGWGQKLRDVIVACDHVRVRSGGLCHRDETTERTLFEITESNAVSELIGHLEINARGSGASCACCGNPTLEFYRGQQLVASVSCQHRRSLRWSGWQGDGLLMRDSERYLSVLMRQHGVDGHSYD